MFRCFLYGNVPNTNLIKEKKMDAIMALRVSSICVAILLPCFYYLFSTSIERAIIFFSISGSMYLIFELYYLTRSPWLSAHSFLLLLGTITGCFFIQFLRIKLIEYMYQYFKRHLRSYLPE
jgi:uncharacterized membrane protein